MEAHTVTPTPTRSPRRPDGVLARLRSIHPVWGLNAVVLGLAVVLYIAMDRADAVARPHIAWWIVAIAFAVAERCVVHVHFRRGAHSFSLGDIPLIFGLIFCPAHGVVLGCLLGSGVMLLLDRRPPPIKLVFNVAQFALHALIAVLVFHALAPTSGVGPQTWLAALVATQASGLVTVILITSAISLSEGVVKLRTLFYMLCMDVVVTMSNTMLGLCGAVLTAADARALPLLLVPSATLFTAYRAYLSERERHRRLEFLYEANRTLARSREIAPALEGLLARSLEAFRAEMAEIILFGSAENPSLRTLLGPGTYRELMEPVDSDIADEMHALVEPGTGRGARTLDLPFGNERIQRYLEGRGVTHAMVAPLPGEERIIGTIMLANRFGVVRSFNDDDLKLLDTLATNASVALQYDRLEQAVLQLSVLQEQLHHQAYHDPLTSLANRALFTDQIREALTAQEALAVMFIDLDDFKTVNDSLGHAAGDELLMAVAGRLQGCLRPEDVVARLGGDEFAVMVREPLETEDAAVAVARRIMDAFAQPVAVGTESVSVFVSTGIAISTTGDTSAEELIRNADVAMYVAKASGKGRFSVFHPSMGTAVLERHGLKEELRLAIEREELRLYFQPIVDLETGSTVATEALVRWEHPRRGLVAPSEFVPLAEETGLILSLGQWVLEEACQRARAWEGDQDESATEIAVHVNLSAVELRDRNLCERVRATLDRTGLDPRRLVFEITETLLLDDAESVCETLRELRALGVRFALDDFGTGYSSLSYLHTLPLDMLKVAKSFVDGLDRGGREASFVRMIIDLARTLGMSVIAEGIETAEQARALAALHCEYGQGFHLGRPSPMRHAAQLPAAA